MEHKNILSVVEIKEGVTKTSYQILAKAREIADELEQEVYALVMGSDVKQYSDDLIAHGADKVVVVDNHDLKQYRTLSYTKVFDKVLDEFKPFAVMLPASQNMRDLGGRIAARRKIGLVAECVQILLNDEKNDIKWIRPTFDGQLYSDIRTNTLPQMGTVAEDVFKALEPTERTGEVIEFEADINMDDLLTEILGSVKRGNSNLSLEDAKIVVAGGLGLKEPKNWHLINELAEVLGAATTGTKPISDQLWIPADRYVGMSGRKVHPRLYFAIGISGSVQHVQGMKDSDIIVAINNDPDAAIFNVAHYGIVGDLFEVVPMLIEKLKKLV
ncbi:electron transfer flavoprotein subunit alpha/FixB family protein [Peptoniphilus asaccharolyticus]